MNGLMLLFALVYSYFLAYTKFNPVLCCLTVDALALGTNPEALRPAAKDPVTML